MKSITLFDPPLCCESGVCGPETDPDLIRMSAWWRRLSGQADAQRHNLAHAPLEFANNRTVRTLLEEKGVEALPCLLIDGEVRISGRYPSENECAEIERQLGANGPAAVQQA